MGALKEFRKKQSESHQQFQEIIDSLFPKAPPAEKKPPPPIVKQPITLPAAQPCQKCGNTEIWSTIYKPDFFQCYECDSPPEFFFVSEILWLIINDLGEPEWEYHPRTPKRISLAVPGEGSRVSVSGYELPVRQFKAADGEIIHTILADFKNPKNVASWSDFLRLVEKLGFDEAWDLLSYRTEILLKNRPSK